MPIGRAEIKRLAGLELNALRAADTLREDVFENARVTSTGTVIHDVNGEPLFHRIPLTRGKQRVAFADIAVNEALGHPLLAVSQGVDWDEKAILEKAAVAARKARRGLTYDKARFVAYSFPKVAVQFLKGDEEVLMLEWVTWVQVPPSRERRRDEPPGDFERWSLLDEMPAATKRANSRKFLQRTERWRARQFAGFQPTVLSKTKFLRNVAFKLIETYEIHYSPRTADHAVCFELRGQETNVWCVGASVEMLLLFYRYRYTQTRLATELGLGTPSNPNGLPYGQEQKVVDTIEAMSSNALDASMIANPTWTVYHNDLKANRPMISFIPGHSRAVAGYTRNLLALAGFTPFRGLLVYDPWPPNAGVITRWENFDTMTYRFAFTAALTLV
jgi:Peptidase_C39 like family